MSIFSVFHKYRLKKNFSKIVENDSFCILPWTHAHLFPTGKVFPCCVAAIKPVGDLKESRFEDIWNSKLFRHLRKGMLNGKRSQLCKVCHHIEKTGTESPRQSFNKTFSKHLPRLLETKSDGSYAVATLPYIDIRFSNVCNFKCRTCDPNHSSLWNADMPGETAPKVFKVSGLKNYPAALVKDSLEVAEEIYFAGGEPLLTKEHYEILTALIEKKRDPRLRYSTNLSVTEFGGYKIKELWSHFSHVVVNVSIDDMNERGEFVRHGLDWNQFRNNFFELKEALPQAAFNLAITVSVLNVETLTTTLEKLLREEWAPATGIYLSILQTPPYFSTQVMPLEMKLRIAADFADFAKRMRNEFGNKNDFVLSLLESVRSFMMAANRQDLLPELQKQMRHLDAKRGENTQQYLPWIF